jgi:hypothetical protein
MFRKFLLSAMLIAGSSAAFAGPIITFSEGFDDVTALAGSGWLQVNNSTPGGETGWFQGNSGVFAAESGAADSYIAANFLNAGFGGNIDNWLITPVLSLYEGSVVSFSARTNGGFPGDNLEVLASLGSSNLADFFSLGAITSDNFPIDWKAFSLLSSSAVDVRLAFRYLVFDTAANGDYIGIDSFEVAAVPEPGTIALFGAALLMMTFAIRRRRDQI